MQHILGVVLQPVEVPAAVPRVSCSGKAASVAAMPEDVVSIEEGMVHNQSLHAHPGVKVVCVVYGHLLLTSLHKAPGRVAQRQATLAKALRNAKRRNAPILSLNELLLR